MYAQPSKSDRRGIPVDSLVNANSISAITGETVQFYYNNAGTLTIDAGQAAGTIVAAKLAYNHILNKLGGNIGVYGDTSLSFTSTAFTTEINLGEEGMEGLDEMTEVERLAFLAGYSTTQVSPFTANGQYFVDYNRGYLYGRKASTQVTLTAAAYSAPSSSSTVTGAVTADITKVGGVAVPTAGADAVSNTRSDVPTSSRISSFNGTTWDRVRSGVITPSATLTGMVNGLPWALYNATPTTRTEGQGGPLQGDTVGNLNTTLGTTIAGEQVTLNYLRAAPTGTPTYISTATTTLVKSGAGILTELVIGKHIATGVIQIYDGLTAVNLVATITTGAALLNDPPFSTLHGMVFNTGLTIVTSQAEFVTAMTI